MKNYNTNGSAVCNDCQQTGTFNYGCQGCSNYDDSTGDCWKDSQKVDNNGSFDKYVLASGKTVWK